MVRFNHSLLATAVVSAILIGCGGGSSGGSSSDSGSSNTSSESTEVSSASLGIQVIDGYLVNVEACVVDHTDAALPCDTEFGNAVKTNDSGKVDFLLEKEQIDKLKERKFVKFKVTVPKGTKDVIFGKESKTSQDYILIGTKYFSSDDIIAELSNGHSLKITPFTTMVEQSLFDTKNHATEAQYNKALSEIADSLGLDVKTITSDYNDPDKIEDKKNQNALIIGEILARTNYMPKSTGNISQHKNNDEKMIDNLKKDLAANVKPIADEIIENSQGTGEISAEDISTNLLENINKKAEILKNSFVTFSNGPADEWRCGVTRANEVWCWGNNAWNNLGNEKFTKAKEATGKYTGEGHDGDLMFLADNYTAKGIPVLIKNPDKKTEADPEYVRLSGVTQVATGNVHACALTLEHEVYCWGGNWKGQLGIGNELYNKDHAQQSYASKVVSGKQGLESGYLGNVTDIAAGQNHTCALTGDGDIYCWGDNTALELGDEFKDDRVPHMDKLINQNGDDISEYIHVVTYPVKVPAPNGVKFSKMTHGGYWAHCALSTPETTPNPDYNLWCWGNDIRSLISGDSEVSAAYSKEIKDKWSNVIYRKNGNEYYDPHKSWTWFYVEDNGEWYPMFGKGITNIESYKILPRYCETGGTCINPYEGYQNAHACTLGDTKYTTDPDTGTTKQYTCTGNDPYEIRNVKSMEITEYDSTLMFTTTDNDKVLYELYADTNMNYDENHIIKIGAYIRQPIKEGDLINGDKIDKIVAGVESVGRFVITENNHLYGYGSQLYGILGNGVTSDSGSDILMIPVISDSKYKIHELSMIKRSVCASVSDETDEDKDKRHLWCWGSSTFGQLGFIDEGDNEFSYGDASEVWTNGWNKYFDDTSHMQPEPKKVDIELSSDY